MDDIKHREKVDDDFGHCHQCFKEASTLFYNKNEGVWICKKCSYDDYNKDLEDF